MFTDRAKIKFIAGKGGNGAVAWRREKFIPKGGPAGGNGGRGASIIIQADNQVFSLEKFRNRRLIRAENGVSGGSSKKQGRNGKDLILKVPCGTILRDIESKQEVYDFTKNDEKWVVCEGGKGGRGNASFATPTNRAPNKCTEGKKGQEKELELELKLIADIGLVGFPNAGKSTLINALTFAKVKIAPYPFTTLRPNLGYVNVDYHRILLADIPGIIDGAHANKGLGLEFLRHVERTKMLLYVIDASGIDGRDPTKDFLVLQQEIKKYNPKILEKPFLVLLNKTDQECAQENIEDFKSNYKFPTTSLLTISALEKHGLKDLLKSLTHIFHKVG